MAIELRAKAVVLAAGRLPKERAPTAFYVALGGTQAKTAGWRVPRGRHELSPVRFESAKLKELKERIDAYRQR